MDINEIKYLLTVYNKKFNLTKSSKVLHVSQPAISKAIKEIEFKQKVKIFNRRKGRIVGLTNYGVVLVKESNKVYRQYNEMISKLNILSNKKNGTVRIGIAQVIISTVFNDALIAFINENPGIRLQLIETGAYDLQKKLVLGDIDLAVIVSPTTDESIYEDPIYESTVKIWFNKKHWFSSFKGSIPFKEVEKEKIVTLTNDFMVTWQLNKRFKGDRVRPQYFLQTHSWDLILNLVQRDASLIGIVADPVYKNYSDKNIEKANMDPIFPWKISLCHTMNSIEDPTVEFAKNWFLNYFDKNNKISVSGK